MLGAGNGRRRERAHHALGSTAHRVYLPQCADTFSEECRDTGAAVCTQDFNNVDSCKDDDGMLILLDFSVSLGIEVARRHKNAKLPVPKP